ncbi:MAG: MazG-like family protein [Carboxylicivirga sp.]|jgi:NTP pyrophosphatase (non-canonical NTP hydrolase)|nr:MazG-like family protein [Carboxylicivirga sp.]
MNYKIYREIVDERQRQDEKWGEQNHKPVEWCAILGEEVGEVNKAALESHFKSRFKCYEEGAKEALANYREELIQVAALAVAMIESLERNEPLYQRLSNG